MLTKVLRITENANSLVKRAGNCYTNLKNGLCKFVGELLTSRTSSSNLLEQLDVVCSKPLKAIARSSFDGGRAIWSLKPCL